MRKLIQKLLLALLIWIISYLSIPKINNVQVYAAYDCTFSIFASTPYFKKVPGKNNAFYYDPEIERLAIVTKGTFMFKFDTSKINWDAITPDFKLSENKFRFWLENAPSLVGLEGNDTTITKDPNLNYVSLHDVYDFSIKDGKHTVKLVNKDNTSQVICEDSYEVVPNFSCQIDSVTPSSPNSDLDSTWTVNVSNIIINSSEFSPNVVYFKSDLGRKPQKCVFGELNCIDVVSLSGNTISYNLGTFPANNPNQNHNVSVGVVGNATFNAPEQIICGPKSFHVYERNEPTYTPTPTLTPSVTPLPTPTDFPGCFRCGEQGNCGGQCGTCSFCQPSITPVPSITPIPPLPDLIPLCDQVDTPGTVFRDSCRACVIGDGGMWTAIGCLPVGGLEVFLKDYLFVFGIGIAGGIAFLYFLYGTFLFLTSAGNAETVAQAKEIIVSALSGLLFIIFSILLLKIVGGDILRIPGFS